MQSRRSAECRMQSAELRSHLWGRFTNRPKTNKFQFAPIQPVGDGLPGIPYCLKKRQTESLYVILKFDFVKRVRKKRLRFYKLYVFFQYTYCKNAYFSSFATSKSTGKTIFKNSFPHVHLFYYSSMTDFLEKILAYFSAGNLKRRS